MKMDPRPIVAIFLATLAPLVAAQTPGEVTDGGVQELRVELVGTQEALERMARTLDQLVRFQKTNLLLQRISIEERRLSPLGSDLRSARSTARGQREEIARMKAMTDEVRARVTESAKQGQERGATLMREELSQIERMTELQEQELAETERRIQELENDMARARRKLDTLDERLEHAFEELDR